MVVLLLFASDRLEEPKEDQEQDQEISIMDRNSYDFGYPNSNEICVEVELFGYSQRFSKKVIAAVDYSSEVTRVSRRLYDRLGYEDYGQMVLVINDTDFYNPHMSPCPMTVRCKQRIFANYPFINSSDEDEHYEMIIGQDLISQNPTFYERFSWTGSPTPGPGFDQFRSYSRNIRLARAGN